MPKKIRDLIQALEKAGFVNRGGKGSHRNFTHPRGAGITLSGKTGNDSKRYQEKQVAQKIKEAENEGK